MLKHFIIQFALYYLSNSPLGKIKKESFKILILKAVAVTYERWSLRRGLKYNDWTSKLLLFWKTGRQGDAVTTRGSTVVTDLGERTGPAGGASSPLLRVQNKNEITEGRKAGRESKTAPSLIG